MMNPYDPPAGTAPGLAPHAETLALCPCGECRARRLRDPVQLLNMPFVPDAAIWRELARRAR